MLNTIYREVGSVVIPYFRSEECKAQWYSVVCLWPYNNKWQSCVKFSSVLPQGDGINSDAFLLCVCVCKRHIFL